MNKLIAVILLFLFSFQVGIKTMVTGYYQFCANEQAKKNCQYKSITVCKGNCYVVKQIKIFSSENHSRKKTIPSIDLSSMKEIFSEPQELCDMCFITPEKRVEFSVITCLYSFHVPSDLFKPPTT